MSNLQPALEYAHQHGERFVSELIDFLKIPSVSTQPKHAPDVAAAAEWLAAAMRAVGIEHVEVIPSSVGKHPLVYGDWLHAGPDAPTVLVYGHFDVQPVEPLELWRTPPFEPHIQDEFLFARGASDDKGQAYIHVKVAEALLKSNGRLPLNVKYIFEGEEEAGGESLYAYLPAHTEKLKADIALVSDTAILAADQPTIVYGLRGMYYDMFDLTGPDHDLHSGEYGGAINNPLNVLGHIIAQLKDQNGRVLVPGFYDNVRELTPEERELLAQLPRDEATWLANAGAPTPWGETDYTITERLGARPTLDVHGIIGGYTDAGAKTVLPSTVHCKFSTRLVPDQDPTRIQQLVRDYIRSLVPPSITIEFGHAHTAPASITDYTVPAMQAARQAYAAVFEKEPVLQRGGGSIPVVGEIQKHLGIETVLMGFGLPSDRIHSPNESFYLPNFHKGIQTVLHFMHTYASLDA